MRAGEDFSRWIDDVLGDGGLAELVHAVELSAAGADHPHRSRNTVVALLERRYLQGGAALTGRD
jgi:hypothetical protein